MTNLSEELAIVGTIDAASQSTSEKLTDAIDMSKFRRVLFLINCGVLGSSATLDFVVKGATSEGGSYASISGTAITQIVKASGDGKQALVEVSAEVVKAAGYRWIKGSLTPGTAASQAAVMALAGRLRYGMAEENDLADVAEIVAKVN
jgi:hypothetical protein